MGNAPRMFRGVGASPGVAIGRAFLLDRGPVRVPRFHIDAGDVDRELQRLRDAVARSVAELQDIRARLVGEGVDHRSILEAHEMMLRDRALFDEAAQLIGGEQVNAEWAVSRVIRRIRTIFEQVSDAYLRERRGDIDFVGERILRNLVGQHIDLADASAALALGHDAVVVARDLSPVDTALLTRHHVLAFVTEIGGKTSHTAIVARSLEVPAVVGVRGILDAAGSGDPIVVDGLDGTVLLRPSLSQRARGARRAEHVRQANAEMLLARALPACTRDGFELDIAGNIELPGEVPTVLARGGSGIGLYRTEFMFVGRSEPPTEDEHYETYRRIFAHVGARPVTVRTLDLGGDKAMGAAPSAPEPNPALGLRAIRFCLAHPELFAAQLGGLLRAAVHGDLRIMLPLVSGLHELLAARALLTEVADGLARAGTPHRRDVPLGIMVETPSAVMVADVLARHSDFFAIGTNDLLQYLLAIDRTNERVAYLYSPAHPAVLRCLRRVAEAARAAAIPVSVCGEMAGDPEMAPLLLAYSFGQLSMHAGAIPRVKQLVRKLRHADCVALLTEAEACEEPQQVEARLQAFLTQALGADGAVFTAPE